MWYLDPPDVDIASDKEARGGKGLPVWFYLQRLGGLQHNDGEDVRKRCGSALEGYDADLAVIQMHQAARLVSHLGGDPLPHDDVPCRPLLLIQLLLNELARRLFRQGRVWRVWGG